MVDSDGWAVTNVSQPHPAGIPRDLSNFGKISKTASMTFGSITVCKDKEGKRDSTLPHGIMLSMLSQNPELANDVHPTPANSSRPPGRKTSVDLGPGGARVVAAAPPVRRELVFQPETLKGARAMSEEQALKQIDEDVKELMSVRNVDEAEEYFVKLPVGHRHRLVDKLVMHSLEAKEDVVELVASVFARAVDQNLCSAAIFEDGFTPAAEMIDDIAIDTPKAFGFLVKLLQAAGLDKEEERHTRLASKSIDSDKMLQLLTS